MLKFSCKFTVIFSLLLAFSCKHEDKNPTAEKAYLKARKLLLDKDYSESAKEFEKIADEYPFSKWSIQAQSMAAYAFYKDKSYSDVARVADDFVRINPTNETVPYMFYIKGLSYYNQMPAIDRAQDNTRMASITFRELIARFPTSDYASDARDRLVAVNEHIAGAKMSVGRYQISQQNYVGAIKNFHDVVSHYRFTDQAPEAYFRLIEIYHKLGMQSEEVKAIKELNEFFPQNNWTESANKINE